MSETPIMDRRQAMKLLAVGGIAGFSSISFAAANKGIGALVPGKGWINSSGVKGEHDGTPLQFIPKGVADDNPLDKELEKYPRCPYCGMSRKKWHHSRHLVHYDDGLADGTCSIHCLAISLSLNLDRNPKVIYAADFGSGGEIKSMVAVDQVSYLLGSKLKATMSGRSKMAFSDTKAAQAAQSAEGGELADFHNALAAAYGDMVKDTMMIRKMRKKKLEKMMEQAAG